MEWNPRNNVSDADACDQHDAIANITGHVNVRCNATNDLLLRADDNQTGYRLLRHIIMEPAYRWAIFPYHVQRIHRGMMNDGGEWYTVN